MSLDIHTAREKLEAKLLKSSGEQRQFLMDELRHLDENSESRLLGSQIWV